MLLLCPAGPLLLPLLLLTAAAASSVSPPENLTVSCQNVHIALYWNYSEQQPDTSFRLTMDGAARPFEKLTQERQYDLSGFMWQTAESYKAVHHVQLTAERGNQSSQTVESPTFTFSELGTAHIKCKLDFPPVTLSVKDSKAKVSFPNPLHFYKELNKITQLLAHQQDKPPFQFSVFSDRAESEGECGVEEEMCRHEVDLCDQSQEECCVRLEGRMFDSSGINTLLFRDTDRICAQEPEQDSYLIILAVVLSVFAVVIVVVTVMICKEKAWEMRSSTPKCLVSLLSNPDVNAPCDPSACTVEPADPKPDCSLILVSAEERSSSAWSDLSPPTGFSGLSESSSSSSSQPPPEDAESDTDSDGGEELPMPYDRPHRLEDMGEDMGDGDMVYCYRGR
ncbi:interferon gamma receptor 1 [Centroberyx affinis]|uniref:interferon gamma receptor 1 n=1 Tax=Centroberyx affinis TaxID=166261 RepID=UPI003A5C0474